MQKEVAKVLDNIRRVRVEQGISIIELAGRAGIAHSALYYVESHRKVPSLDTLAKIAKGLGVKMKDLFD